MASMPFSTSHTMDSLKYIDAQLVALELDEEENNLVRAHRLQSLELRQKRMSQLGPMPSTHPEIWNWEKQKTEAEAEIKLALETTLLSVPGLEAAWSKHLEIDKMKKMRADIISSVTNALQAPSGQEAPATSAPASSGSQWDFAIPQMPANWDASAHIQHMQQQHEAQHQRQQAEEQAQHDDGKTVHYVQGLAGAHPGDVSHIQQVINAPPGVPIKLCRRCNQHKPLTDFYRSKANADGYDGRCKACDAIQCAERRRKKARVEEPTVPGKECRRCNVFKAATEFYRNKTNPDGLYNNCKACFAADAWSRRQRMAPLEQRTVPAKVCKRCGLTKSASEFYRNKLMSDGLYSHCKACYSQAAEERSAGRVPAETKECRRCHETKGKADFYHSKMTADGLQSYCKQCYSVASAQRRSRTTDGGLAQGSGEDGQQSVMHLENGVPVYQDMGMNMQEMLPPTQDLSHAAMQAEHLAGIDQQHHHLAQQHALGHHDPTILAAHHQALAAAQDSSQHLPPEALDTSHAQYTAQGIPGAEHLNLHALQQHALPSEITLNLQGPSEA
ncbi:hypothetical protein CVIRNUC_006581 [Coccomyxa viridis]|uniref:Uncharacterized protein n=1 Tax=Coccomyxa viridis TaxID=1274662 RepID=A0AAV1I9M2_9CHLO|nr:hypothetical protein CVIRNUC_006581 [Coccomyxa viridis]